MLIIGEEKNRGQLMKGKDVTGRDGGIRGTVILNKMEFPGEAFGAVMSSGNQKHGN